MVGFLVKRPIGTTMVYIAIAALGILAGTKLPVSLMPNVEIPEITIQASYENFNPRQIEQSILAPLRSELLQVLHLEDIQSEAQSGQGIITLRFDYGTNIDYAAIEVNEKVDGIMGRMPGDMQRPKVIKASSVDIPVLTLNLSLKSGTADKQRFLELSDFAEMVIRRRIEQIPEVALVDASGLSFPEIRITLDTSKVKQLGLSFADISKSIRDNSHEIGNIIVREGYYQYNVKIGNSLISEADLKNLLIRKQDRIYRLGELADIVTVPKTALGVYDANGSRAIAMDILKQSDARLEDMAEAVKNTIHHLENQYPELSFEITRDQSQLLTVTINSLRQSLWLGGSLAFLVLFFFLKDIRAPFLIGFSIPVSLIVSLLCFQLADITINIISLSGLLLGIGMMIDNSIIVIDNISQYLERGSSLIEACVRGAEEVFRPLLSSVLTTCAVFIPLIFLSGISGALFYDQALAVTIGLFSSLGVSVTLIPVYFHLLYKSPRLSRWNQRLHFIKGISLEGLYRKSHQWVTKHQWLMGMVFVLILAAAWPLYRQLTKERFPQLTQTAGLLTIDWNENIHVEENHARILKLIAPSVPQLTQYNSLIGQQQFLLSGENTGMSGNEARLYFKAQNEEQLALVKTQLKTRLQQEYPYASFEFSTTTNAFEQLFSSARAPLIAQIRFEETRQNENVLDKLQPLQTALTEQFPNIKILPTEKVLDIYPNHENLLLYKVDVNQLVTRIKTLLNKNNIGELKSFQRFTKIKAAEASDDFFHLLEKARVTNYQQVDIPLKYLVTTAWSEAPKKIYAGKDGSYYPYGFEASQSNVDAHIKQIKSTVKQVEGVNVDFTGSLFQNKQLLRELTIVLVIALTLLYFILAAQFESVWQPFIILMEVPLNIVVAFAGLYLLGASLNIMSLIGIVVMSGVIVNDSILKIDTINQLRKQGYSVNEAVAAGGERRLKPILMTSITTILALAPFLFSHDLGSELQQPLAIAVISGMLAGTLVSLYYIPLFYQWVTGEKTNRKLTA